MCAHCVDALRRRQLLPLSFLGPSLPPGSSASLPAILRPQRAYRSVTMSTDATSASSSVVSSQDVDAWIAKLQKLEKLDETQVQLLCDMARSLLDAEQNVRPSPSELHHHAARFIISP